MTMFLTTIAALLLIGGMSTFAVKFLIHSASKERAEVGLAERENLVKQIRAHDEEISKALPAMEKHLPYDHFTTAETECSSLKEELQAEIARVEHLEKQIEEMQGRVDDQSAAHAALKLGRQDCDRIADELRASQEQLLGERARLEEELKRSQEQMDTLKQTAALNPVQIASLAEVQESLRMSIAQVAKLAMNYEELTSRFLTLENQYVELEKEFRKLVDQELRGEM